MDAPIGIGIGIAAAFSAAAVVALVSSYARRSCARPRPTLASLQKKYDEL